MVFGLCRRTFSSVNRTHLSISDARKIVFQQGSAAHGFTSCNNTGHASATRSVVDVMSTALRGPFLRSYYRQVQEVWDWERASGLDWTDLKKESIRIKLLSLAKRGKGPLVVSQQKKQKKKK